MPGLTRYPPIVVPPQAAHVMITKAQEHVINLNINKGDGVTRISLISQIWPFFKRPYKIEDSYLRTRISPYPLWPAPAGNSLSRYLRYLDPSVRYPHLPISVNSGISMICQG